MEKTDDVIVSEVKIAREDVPGTIHDLITQLTQYLNLTPEQQFRVTAKIKRYVHAEKWSVYSRYSRYAKDFNSLDIADLLSQSAENHKELMNRSDEEVVTWDIGTHKYKKD